MRVGQVRVKELRPGTTSLLRIWPREVMHAFRRATHELYEEPAAKEARFRCIYENWRAYRDEQYQWFRVAEHTYESFAFAAAAR